MESTTRTLSSVSSVRSGLCHLGADHDDCLYRKVDGEHWQWKETARWVKFEEDVEEVSNSFYIIIIIIINIKKVIIVMVFRYFIYHKFSGHPSSFLHNMRIDKPGQNYSYMMPELSPHQIKAI